MLWGRGKCLVLLLGHRETCEHQEPQVHELEAQAGGTFRLSGVLVIHRWGREGLKWSRASKDS